MNIRLPDKYEPERIAEILSKVLTQLEKTAKDKRLNKLTTLGTEPIPNSEDLDIGLYVNPNDNVHTLSVKSQNRNWSIALTEET